MSKAKGPAPTVPEEAPSKGADVAGRLTEADRAKMRETRHIEHLKLIQAAITRLATNSFQMKGWAITLVAALAAVGAWKDHLTAPLWAAFGASILFGYLDTWFLRMERAHRKLFDDVRAREESPDEASFDMNVSGLIEGQTWWSVFWSPTIAPLYLSITWAAGLVAATWSFPHRSGQTCACGLPLSPVNPWWVLVSLVVLLLPLWGHRWLVPRLTRALPAAPNR